MRLLSDPCNNAASNTFARSFRMRGSYRSNPSWDRSPTLICQASPGRLSAAKAGRGRARWRRHGRRNCVSPVNITTLHSFSNNGAARDQNLAGAPLREKNGTGFLGRLFPKRSWLNYNSEIRWFMTCLWRSTGRQRRAPAHLAANSVSLFILKHLSYVWRSQASPASFLIFMLGVTRDLWPWPGARRRDLRGAHPAPWALGRRVRQSVGLAKCRVNIFPLLKERDFQRG